MPTNSILVKYDNGRLYYQGREICDVRGAYFNNDITISIDANMEVYKVYFNDPATIVLWEDGTKTIVKAQNNEPYDKEKGLAMCFMKKAMGNTGNFNDKMNELIDPDFKKKRKEAKKLAKKDKKNSTKKPESQQKKQEATKIVKSKTRVEAQKKK